MKNSQEIFDKIATGQEKLQGICDAINKDQLIAETKAKDILVLEKKEKSLEKSIALLKQLESDSKMILSATQEKNEAVMVEMVSRKAKLQAEIDKQIQKIDDVGIIMMNEEAKHNEQIKKLASEYSTAIDEFNKKKEELGQWVEEMQNSNKFLIEENKKLESVRQKILDQIGENQKTLDWQLPLLSAILENERRLWDIESKRKWIEEELFEYNKQKISIIKEIEEAKAQIEEIKKELNVFVSEKDKYVQERITLNLVKEQLNEKESYVKWKYESAWLKYF